MVSTPPVNAGDVLERIRRSASTLAAGLNVTLSFHAMGTVCRVTCPTHPASVVKGFHEQVLHWVAAFEAKYSRFLDGSLISRINAAAGEHWTDIDEETQTLLKLCGEMYFFTRGAFDPTALPLIRLWNWKAQPVVIPASAQLAEARELCGWNKIQLRPGGIFLPRRGMSLDLGGIGKEYAVDRVVQLAAQCGVESVLVDFGQDIRVGGRPPAKGAWHIGLEDPKQPGQCWAGVAVTGHAVATSGDYLRHFVHDGRRYGHIIDPRDGQPVYNRCLAVSVIAPTCTVAGILSTSAFILGPTEGLQLISQCLGAEGCITTDQTRHQTRKFHEYVTH
ncbi:MAG: FAD:protein FMN transferase [Verrucomicrobiota bacterium]